MNNVNKLSFLGLAVLVFSGLSIFCITALSVLGWASLLDTPIWVVALVSAGLFFQKTGTNTETGMPLSYGLMQDANTRNLMGGVFNLAAPAYLCLIGFDSILALSLYLPFGILSALRQAGYRPLDVVMDRIFNTIQSAPVSLAEHSEAKVSNSTTRLR